jgi:hypothetical protein
MRKNSRKYGVYSESDNYHEGKSYHFFKELSAPIALFLKRLKRIEMF